MDALSDLERFERFCASIELRLEDYQRERILPEAFGTCRELLVTMPRGNGKTTLIGALALFDLLRDPRAAIYVAAASRDQAQILFDEASKLAQRNSFVASRVTATRRELRTSAGGSLRVISADADKQLGLIPSRVIVDELGSHPNDELYVALRTAMLKVPTSKIVVLSTAAVLGEGPLWDLRERCLAQPEIHRDGVLTVARGEHLAMLEWSLPADWPLDRAVECNPASWITADGLQEQRTAVHESAFRRFHANQWINAATEPWLPREAWDACAAAGPTTDVEWVLGFDGSFNGDSTALVACSIEEQPHVRLVALWEHDGDPDWRVPIGDVEDEIRAACRRDRVREIAADPYRWARSLEILAGERLPVLEFPQTQSRMIPATTRLYEAIANAAVTHCGSPDLARHVGNAVLRVGRNGGQLSKASKGSPRRIDAAVAAVMAHDRAAWHARHQPINLADNIH